MAGGAKNGPLSAAYTGPADLDGSPLWTIEERGENGTGNVQLGAKTAAPSDGAAKGGAAGRQIGGAAATDTRDPEAAAPAAREQTGLIGRLRLPDMKWYGEIGGSPWWEVMTGVCTVVATPAAFVPLPFAMARLGWWAGLPALLVMWTFSQYNALLLTSLHQWDRTMRHCRYRDLAKSILGTKGFYFVFFFQQMNAIAANVAVYLISSLVMKDIWENYHGEHHNIKIFVWVAIFAVFQLILSQLPTIHQLSHCNAVMTVAMVVFVGLVVGESLDDGLNHVDRSKVSYGFKEESTRDAIFKGFTSFGILAYAFSNTMIPEIQSLVKPPAVPNGNKGVTAAYTFIGICAILIAVPGYWAFGNAVRQVILVELVPKRSWSVTLAEVLLIVHGAFHAQMFARPTFEVMEYLLLDWRVGLLAPRNILARLCGTTVYVGTVAFVTCILPSALDEVAVIVGVLGFVPLDLVLPMWLHDKARKSGRLRRTVHNCLAAFWILAALLRWAESRFDSFDENTLVISSVVGVCYSIAHAEERHIDQFFTDVDPDTQLGNDI